MEIKKSYFIFTFIVLSIFSCNSILEDECHFSESKSIEKEIILTPFDEVIVYNRIKLYVKESPIHKVIIETSENLIDKIKIKTIDNLLEISEHKSCSNYLNSIIANVYIYSPNIKKIRNSSIQPVVSIETLNYPKLELISENYLSDYINSGNFNLDLNTQNLEVIANGVSTFNLKGFTKKTVINFAGNSPRFEGSELTINNAFLFARSTNDIIIKVDNDISGNLYSTGDVILLKEPLTLNLKSHYTGKIITNY